jgi:tetratricopeptide (TPR) repeat protein
MVVTNRNVSSNINPELQTVNLSTLNFLAALFNQHVRPVKSFCLSSIGLCLLILSLLLLLQFDILDPVVAQPAANDTTEELLKSGETLYAEGDLANAIRYYNEVLAIEPNNTGAIYDKGLALDVLGKHEDAIIHYDMLLSVQPDNINALVNKGAALADMGNYQEAITYFDRVLSIDPNNVLAAENKKLATSLLDG